MSETFPPILMIRYHRKGIDRGSDYRYIESVSAPFDSSITREGNLYWNSVFRSISDISRDACYLIF